MTVERFTFFGAGPFSQWFKCEFDVDGQQYVTAEQYMMAEKARLFGDEVIRGNRAKFLDNPDLLEKLFGTEGTTIVEASPDDHIWGNGLAETDPDALDRQKWKGSNWLGEVLTKLRDDLISEMRNGDKI